MSALRNTIREILSAIVIVCGSSAGAVPMIRFVAGTPSGRGLPEVVTMNESEMIRYALLAQWTGKMGGQSGGQRKEFIIITPVPVYFKGIYKFKWAPEVYFKYVRKWFIGRKVIYAMIIFGIFIHNQKDQIQRLL